VGIGGGLLGAAALSLLCAVAVLAAARSRRSGMQRPAA
jgi:hypothetical protein